MLYRLWECKRNIPSFCAGFGSVTMFFVQKDDMDGEIDLKFCVKVSEFDVEKNYGFQIQVVHITALCMWLIFFFMLIQFLSSLTTPAFICHSFTSHRFTSLSVSPPPVSLSFSFPLLFLLLFPSLHNSVTYCVSTFVFQTREAVFTLSAMTAGIRRNWIEVLKKCVRPSSSPDLTQ